MYCEHESQNLKHYTIKVKIYIIISRILHNKLDGFNITLLVQLLGINNDTTQCIAYTYVHSTNTIKLQLQLIHKYLHVPTQQSLGSKWQHIYV